MTKEARNPNDEKPAASPIRHSSFVGLKKWLWIGAAGLALIFTGDRLRLASPNPNVLRFAHTFTTESERAIIDAAIAEFEKANPPLRVEQIVLNSEVYQTIGWRLQFQGRQQPDVYFLWQ